MVPTLQELLVRIVPTKDIIHNNITHVLGFQNRFVKDLMYSKVESIPQWFLCFLMDRHNSSFFWFSEFIHHKIHSLEMNQSVFVGYQEAYKKNYSMNMFAMRVSMEKVILFVYANPNQERDGYQYRRVLPFHIQDQKLSREWKQEDWDYLSCLRLDCMFIILSSYQQQTKKTKTTNFFSS